MTPSDNDGFITPSVNYIAGHFAVCFNSNSGSIIVFHHGNGSSAAN
jgi:acetate kinase